MEFIKEHIFQNLYNVCIKTVRHTEFSRVTKAIVKSTKE